jgi:hypothetical protein
MLIIRDAQREAFVEDRVRQLRAWLLPHVRAHFAPQVAALDDDTLGALIERAVARARALGATRSETISRFVHLRVVFGEALETQPWAAETLADTTLAGDAKIDRLLRRARQALRARGAAR